ncbi:MAG: hypothetical protein M3Z87_12360, partial [Lactobacillus sp.]|nr:hypothetical protein [Lactobacillus sp.]
MKQRKSSPIEILVTIDQNYLKPLEVMMYSVRLNNLDQDFRVWLIHDNIDDSALAGLEKFCEQ